MIGNRKFIKLILLLLVFVRPIVYSQTEEIDNQSDKISISGDYVTNDTIHYNNRTKDGDTEKSGELGKFFGLLALAIVMVVLINLFLSKKRLQVIIQEKNDAIVRAKIENNTALSEIELLNSKVKVLHKKQAELEQYKIISNKLLTEIRRDNVLSNSILSKNSKQDIFLNAGIQNVIVCQLLEDEKYLLNMENISIEKVLTELVSYLEPLGIKQSLEITISRKEDSLVYADANLLKLVLLNLLLNAMMYSESLDSIRINIEYSDQKHIKLFVIDSGRGISKKHHEGIFKKFFRIGKNVDANPDSAGLGLYLCSLALSLLGGEITVESKVEEGAKFVVSMPTTNKEVL